MMTKDQLAAYEVNHKYDFTDAVISIQKNFGASDYIVANLETPAAGEELGYTKEKYSFNTPIELVSALKQCGVDLVTTANNHCLDRGSKGLVKTCQNLKKYGMDYIGTHTAKEDSCRLMEIGGIKVGFLSFTYGTNAFANHNYLKSSRKYMVDLLQGQELHNPIVRKLWTGSSIFIRAIRKMLRILGQGQFDVPVYERQETSRKEIAHYKKTIEDCRRAGAEYIISCLHIGGQYNGEPTDYTKKICRLSLNLGVNAVIANHEHVIHGIDREQLTEQKFCIYSLGNFLSACGVLEEPFDKMAQYSAAVSIDLHRDSRNKIKAGYSFKIFRNAAKADGKVVSMPFLDYLAECGAEDRKECIREHNLLINRIYHTEDVSYPVLEEYKILV